MYARWSIVVCRACTLLFLSFGVLDLLTATVISATNLRRQRLVITSTTTTWLCGTWGLAKAQPRNE